MASAATVHVQNFACGDVATHGVGSLANLCFLFCIWYSSNFGLVFFCTLYF